MEMIYESEWAVVMKANPAKLSQEMMEIEYHIVEHGFDLKSVTESNGEMFFFLIKTKAS